MELGEFYPSRIQLQWDDKAPNLGFWPYTLEHPPLTVIELDGRIESEKCLAPIVEIAASSEAGHVAILMQNVEYATSDALEGLISLHDEVEERGFCMYVVSPVEEIKTAMEALGGYESMHIRESLKEVILEVREP